MKRRVGLMDVGAAAFAALLLSSISLYATSAAYAEDEVTDGAAGSAAEVIPGGDGSVRAPGTVFTINAVLAKLDRERGRGPNAVRLAALSPPSSPISDAATGRVVAPMTGDEPFGLFTFRAPDGVLWRKWRAVEAEMAKEKVVLDTCHDHADACPSHAA